jgi:hypothetical protein
MKNIYFGSVLLILLVSCATPRNILKLKPQSDKTSWFYGQEFTGDSVFGIIAKVAFDQVEHPWYAFDVEITNRSNMDYLVDPANIFIVPLNGKSEPLNGDTIYVVDPEQKIAEIDQSLSVNTANRKNQLGLSLLAAGIDIATGVAVLSDDNPKNDNLRTDLLPVMLANGEENKFEAIDLNQLRDTWKQTTLRKTTLEKGFAIHGKLLAPVCPDASYIQLNIPVDNALIRINFMQIQFVP